LQILNYIFPEKGEKYPSLQQVRILTLLISLLAGFFVCRESQYISLLYQWLGDINFYEIAKEMFFSSESLITFLKQLNMFHESFIIHVFKLQEPKILFIT